MSWEYSCCFQHPKMHSCIIIGFVNRNSKISKYVYLRKPTDIKFLWRRYLDCKAMFNFDIICLKILFQKYDFANNKNEINKSDKWIKWMAKNACWWKGNLQYSFLPSISTYFMIQPLHSVKNERIHV